MASILIRNLDDRLKDRLRLRAARNKRSMEEEARNILKTALSEQSTLPPNLAHSITARFKELGGVDLSIAKREPMREPPKPPR